VWGRPRAASSDSIRGIAAVCIVRGAHVAAAASQLLSVCIVKPVLRGAGITTGWLHVLVGLWDASLLL
jgi:hypothetical protein